jgi:hypothetical protein
MRADMYITATLALLSLSVVLPATQETNVKFGHEVLFGSTFLRFPDSCTTIVGEVTAGDFFDRLERTDSAQGAQFSLGKEPVESFPDRFTVTIQTLAMPCPSPKPADVAPTIDISSLKFETQWSQGGPKIVVPDSAVTLNYFPEWGERSTGHRYSFDVNRATHSLTDTLGVTLLTAKGEKVAQFKVDLRDWQPPMLHAREPST